MPKKATTKAETTAAPETVEVECIQNSTTKAETTAAPETVEVECIQNYKDLCLDRIVKVGERQEVTPERAALLLEENLVKRV